MRRGPAVLLELPETAPRLPLIQKQWAVAKSTCTKRISTRPSVRTARTNC